MAWSVTVQPTDEPLSLEECKLWLKVDADQNERNGEILSLLRAVRMYAEGYQNRTLMSATYEQDFNRFPEAGCALELAHPPLTSVTSITYVDTAGATQTWSSTLYSVDIKAEPGWVYPKFAQVYPTTRDQPNAVRVTFVAGYASAITVPFHTKLGLLKMMADNFEQPGQDIIGASVTKVSQDVEALLSMNRVLLAA